MHPGLLRCRPSALRLGALITVDSYSTMCSHTISALCLRIPSGLHSFTALCRVGLQPRARLDGARCCVYIAARANADPKARFWVWNLAPGRLPPVALSAFGCRHRFAVAFTRQPQPLRVTRNYRYGAPNRNQRPFHLG